MSEISEALRRFADLMDQGKQLPNATHVAIVLGDDAGNAEASYIGRATPPTFAGTLLLADGIKRLAAAAAGAQPVTAQSVAAQPQSPFVPPFGASRSTH